VGDPTLPASVPARPMRRPETALIQTQRRDWVSGHAWYKWRKFCKNSDGHGMPIARRVRHEEERDRESRWCAGDPPHATMMSPFSRSSRNASLLSSGIVSRLLETFSVSCLSLSLLNTIIIKYAPPHNISNKQGKTSLLDYIEIEDNFQLQQQ